MEAFYFYRKSENHPEYLISQFRVYPNSQQQHHIYIAQQNQCDMIIRTLLENENLRLVEIIVDEIKKFELKIMNWSFNDMLEDFLAEECDIVSDYISFDPVNEETRTTHHYNSNLDCEKVISALKKFSDKNFRVTAF